jgi:hypothetical protein
VPARWKGKCQTGQDFNATSCNRKIIGARWYSRDISPEVLQSEYKSARDSEGHGTHVASTIAGVEVRGVSYGGLGTGVARGGAPRARLGIYKVCWKGGGCSDAAVLAAIDDAIHDGVDVLSLSVGGGAGHEMPGPLHAAQRGISVVLSGGNDGPVPQTVANVAPWVTTVAASTIDRAFPTMISLGNKEKLVVSTNNLQVIILCVCNRLIVQKGRSSVTQLRYSSVHNDSQSLSFANLIHLRSLKLTTRMHI